MERFRSIICADLVLRKGNQILLMKRQNTGTDDGYYELPGGHLEKDEDIVDAMIREAKEELHIKLKRKDLSIIQVFHHYTGERMNIIFACSGENLNPTIGEKEKCSELKWVEIDKLPKNTTKKVKTIIKNIKENNQYDRL